MSVKENLSRCHDSVMAEFWVRIPKAVNQAMFGHIFLLQAKLPSVFKSDVAVPGWLAEADASRKVAHIRLVQDGESMSVRIFKCSTAAENARFEDHDNVKLRSLASHLVVLNGHLCMTGEACCTCGNRLC